MPSQPEGLASDDALDDDALDDDALEGDAPAADELGSASGQAVNGGLSPQWHDIQATFVDDPRGSVQMAAEAADSAIAALVDELRQRQAAIPAQDAESSTSPADTEELRVLLRSYRVFCESVSDLSMQLPLVGPGSHVATSPNHQ